MKWQETKALSFCTKRSVLRKGRITSALSRLSLVNRRTRPSTGGEVDLQWHRNPRTRSACCWPP